MSSQRSLIDEVREGYEFFWNNPEKPWRKKIYEEKLFASSLLNFGKKQNVESVSGQKEDLSESGRGMRDMRVQSDNLIRFTPQTRKIRKES